MVGRSPLERLIGVRVPDRQLLSLCMQDYSKLKGINPEKFLSGNDYSLFLSLALINNDLGDLVYLQGLHARSVKKIKYPISAEHGRKTGRDIYIFRLALSHLFNILEFFYKRIKDIEKDNLLNKIINEDISTDEKLFWDLIITLSKSYKDFGKDKLAVVGINPELLRVISLSEAARNDVTFHYHGTPRHLKLGFESAFKNNSLPNTKYAFVTEIGSVAEDRRYYIDISLEKFLEKEAGLEESIYKTESLMVDFIANLNRVIYKILFEFHKTLGFEDLNEKES